MIIETIEHIKTHHQRGLGLNFAVMRATPIAEAEAVWELPLLSRFLGRAA